MNQEFEQCCNLRKRCIQLANSGKDGNLQSCFSSIEILYTLYWKILNWNVSESLSDSRDIFVLSKGQSSLALACVLEAKGLFSEYEVNSFCKFGSRFSMQFDYTKFRDIGGVENSAGSLGHGLPMAVGMAWADKIRRNDNRIYVLCGDGEMNEGSMWEACVLAVARKLDNLTIIIDNNNSLKKMLKLYDLNHTLQSLGFVVYDVDGHNIGELTQAMNKCKTITERPQVLIANTIRGYGCNTIMNDNSWFHRFPRENEIEKLYMEVNEFEKSNE